MTILLMLTPKTTLAMKVLWDLTTVTTTQVMNYIFMDVILKAKKSKYATNSNSSYLL